MLVSLPAFIALFSKCLTWYLVFVGLCRLCLAYGGSDVTRTFFWLLQRAGFPYRDCQLSNRLDCQLLQHLKETFCHLDQVCVSQVGRVLVSVHYNDLLASLSI